MDLVGGVLLWKLPSLLSNVSGLSFGYLFMSPQQNIIKQLNPLIAIVIVIIIVDSSFVPPIIYAVFGSSKNVAVGTVAAASLLMASIISSDVSPTEQTELYVRLFYTAAFIAGIFQLALGVFRWVIENC